jgi:aminoglycoside phosphotransferase (APT) family kinase protein
MSPADGAPAWTGRLRAYLDHLLPDAAGELVVEPIIGGESNPTFFVTLGNRRLVLRKQPDGQILPSAHAVDREHRVMTALFGSGVPVPRTLGFSADRGIVGTPFYLMERLEGRIFHDSTLPGLSPAERTSAYLAMADTLAALHRVDPQAVGLADYGRPGRYFERDIARWTRQWELSKTRSCADIETLIAWLPANIPDEDEPTTIVHGDFRPGNVMLHPSEPRVVGVLDWELSTLGHPLADLAHSLIPWYSKPDEYGGIMGLDLKAMGVPSAGAYAERYAQTCGHTARLAPFHLAFALFRFAVIFEGIAARAAAGSAAGHNAAEVGHLCHNFARRALEVLDQGERVAA